MVPAIRELPPPPIDSGTEPGTGENPDDTWTKVTSLDGLEGTWEAKGRVTTQGNGTVEIHQAIIYPVDGVDSSNKPVKDGVLFKFLDDGGRDFYVEKNVFEDGSWAKEIWKATSGTYYTNHLQTELKIVLNFDKSKEIESASEWLLYQKDTIYSGDFFVSYSEDFPYIETLTIIFHKTSESIDPGENPDSGTNPGTEPGTGENPDDIWTKVTSLDVLEGTWESYAKNTVAVPVSDTDTVSFTCITEAKYTIPYSGDVSRTMITDYTEYVKASAKYQGKEEQLVWQEFKDKQRPGEDTNGNSITFSEKAPYTMTYTYSESREQAEKEFTSGFIAINQLKTRIKINIVDSNPCISSPDDGSQNPVKNDEEWKKFQEEYVKKHGVFSGDMKTTFSAGAPYTVTTTQILHKQ